MFPPECHRRDRLSGLYLDRAPPPIAGSNAPRLHPTRQLLTFQILFLPPDSASEPGTIRGDYCIELGRNVIHGSDAVESAQHEIGLWFPEGVTSYERCDKAWIYE